ncbi:MAG: hypothetical protein Kow0092_18220 [Deferrisomatales bacterium]
MRYGIRVIGVQPLPGDPRQACRAPWAGRLPRGDLAAVYFGSEFCEDALPTPRAARELCALGEERGLEAVVLTPMVTDRGLAGVGRLLDALAGRPRPPSVVFNDWGVLGLLRERFPHLRRRGGRLLNRSLRDPRGNPFPPPGPPEGGPPVRAQRLRRLLRAAGAVALETDPDALGGYLGEGDEGLERTLHLPYAFAASGRNCLVRAAGSPEGGFVRALGRPCEGRPCGAGPRRVAREDTPVPLWRAGNTVFQEAPEAWVRAQLGQTDRIVVHPYPAP